jgi:peptidoglycan/LPS O-acetylase OafA/YrhL
MDQAPREKVFFSLLDQLRAVAALLVVFGHLVGNFLAYTGREWGPNSLIVRFVEDPLQAEIHFAWFGVVSFFFISGFVITRAASHETGVEFAIKRVLRIYPALVFAVLVVVGLAVAGILVVGLAERPTAGETLLAVSLANWFIPGQPTVMLAVASTLAIEVLFYLAMLAARPLLLRAAPLVPVVLLGVIAIAALFAPLASGGASLLILNLAHLPFLVLGQIVYLVRSGRLDLRLGVLLCLSAALVAVFALDATNAIASTGSHYANSALAFVVFLVLVLVEERIRPTRFLAVVAKRSYSLYLLHVPIGFTVLELLIRHTAVPYTLALLVALVATAAVTEVCYRLIERPSIQLGKYLGRRVRRTPTIPLSPDPQ